MKRLCIFYRDSIKWEGKPVEWIVCKECQKKIVQGTHTALAKLAKLPESDESEGSYRAFTPRNNSRREQARVARNVRMESLERGPI